MARGGERNERSTVKEGTRPYMLNTLRNPIPIPSQRESLKSSVGEVMERGILTLFSFSQITAIVLYTNGRSSSRDRMLIKRITQRIGT